MRVLREVPNPRQVPGEPRVRWWQSDYFDLFVWFEPDEQVWGFQLCYDRCFGEHAITWRREHDSIAHHAIDDGELGGFHPQSTMLRAAKQAVPTEVAERFRAAAVALPPEFTGLIDAVLGRCGAAA